MPKPKTYENYPLWTVVLSNAVALSIYGLSLFIMLRLGRSIALIYLIFILLLELRLLGQHCPNCFYYGKICGFGKGRISSWLFKKGKPARFLQKKISWKDLLPDLLVSLVPFISGIVLLIIKFDPVILIAVLLLMFLTTSGNGYIRGSLTCPHCKQRTLGCPAEKMFRKKK